MSQLRPWIDRATITYLMFLLTWLGLRAIWFDRLFVIAMLNLGALYLLLPLAIALPWALWRKRWRLLAGFMIPLAFALQAYGPLFLPSWPASATASSADIPLKVMTFNVLASNRDFDAIAQAIRRESPDIVGFQELSPQHLPELVARLGQDYPYSAVHPQPHSGHGNHTVGLLSRVAFANSDARPKPLANPPLPRGIQVTLDLQGQPLTLLVAHFAPPLSPTAVRRHGWRQWIAISHQHHLQRRAQAKEIQAIAQANQAAQTPLLMLCDCNMTSTTETYQTLSELLSDSFAERGWGLGHTFLAATRGMARVLPIQRLDYAWHSDSIIAIESYVGQYGGSDHLPLVAQLRMRGDRD